MISRTLARRTLPAALWSLTACVPVPPGGAQLGQDGVRQYLEAEASRRAAMAGADGGRERPEFFADSSRALPGVVYHWARLRLPNPTHAEVLVAAAVLRNRVFPLNGLDDWNRLFRGSRARLDDSVTVRSCEEAVRVTSPFRDPLLPATLFTGLGFVPDKPVVDLARLRSEAGPPVVTRVGGGSWQVVAWLIERGGTTRYTCTVGAHGVSSRSDR